MAKKKIDSIEVNTLTVGQMLEEAQKEANEQPKNGPGGESKGDEKPAAYYGELIDSVMNCYTSLESIEKSVNESSKSASKAADYSYFDDMVLETLETMPVLRGDMTNAVFPLTDPGTTDISALNKVPAIFGLGAALIINTINSLFGEGSAFAQFITSQSTVSADEGTAKVGFKGMLAAIGSDVAGLGVGLLAIAAAATAFKLVDPSSVGIMLATVSGLGLIVVGLAYLSEKLLKSGLSEQLEPLAEAMKDVSITLVAATGAIVLASLAARVITNVGETVVTLLGVISLTSLMIVGSAMLVKLLGESGTSTEALAHLGESILAIGKTLLIVTGVLALSAILSRFVDGAAWATFSAVFAVTAALITGMVFLAKLSDEDSAKAIEALGNTMLKIGVSMLLIAGVIAIGALITPLIVNGLLGVILVIGVTGFILHEIIKVASEATEETVKALNALSLSMLAAGAMFMLVGATMLIVSQIPITPGTMIALGLLLATTALLLYGMDDAVKAASKVSLADIAKAAAVLGLGVAVLMGVGATIALVAQYDPAQIWSAIGAITIMLGLVAVLGVAMFIMGNTITPILPQILIGAAIAIVVTAAVSGVVYLITQVIGSAIQAITASGLDMDKAIAASLQIAGVIGSFSLIALSVIGFAAVGTLAVAFAGPALFGLLALEGVIIVISKMMGWLTPEVMAAFEDSEKLLSISETFKNLTVVAGTIGLLAIPLLASSMLASLALPGLVILEGVIAKIASFATSIGLIAQNMDPTALDTVTESIGSLGSLSSTLAWAVIMIAFNTSLLANINLDNLDVLSTATTKLVTMSQTLQTANFAEGFNSLHEQIASISFTLVDALKLSAAIGWVNIAFANVSDSFNAEMIGKIDGVATAFEKLANLSSPMQDLASALREVADASKDLENVKIGKVTGEMSDVAASSESISGTLKESSKKPENNDNEWRNRLFDLLNSIQEELSNIKRASRGTYAATKEASGN